ncbi:MAG: nitroreductase family protein [Verrucomicrobia bacterium]|nr:nitroreductase family protein [Verrucomicrobiota bacterium]
MNRFLPERLPPDQIDEVLTAGLWAQNHRLTQPWRFLVLGPITHRKLAELYAEVQTQVTGAGANPDQQLAIRHKAVAKFMARPNVVVVAYVLSGDVQQRREDYAATCCAVQNIQLAAWNKGIGMQWSTHATTRAPDTYRLLGLGPTQEEIVGFLFFGKPAEVPPPASRKPLDEVRRHCP